MVLPWQHECVYRCNIIFETHKSNVEMLYTQIYFVIYFLYMLFMEDGCMDASADLVTLEGEYPPWGVLAIFTYVVPV